MRDVAESITPETLCNQELLTVNDDADQAFRAHVLADLHEISRQLGEFRAEFDKYRPLLDRFAPLLPRPAARTGRRRG